MNEKERKEYADRLFKQMQEDGFTILDFIYVVTELSKRVDRIITVKRK